MRIRICLLTILTALPAGWAQTDPPAAVTVPDAAQRAVLEDSLGLAAGEPILATDLAELTDLGARDSGLDRLAEAHQVTRSAKGSATRSPGDPVPSRSIPVRMVTDTRTSATAVARFLETRGVTSDTLGAGGSGTRGILRADVPVPLLARLAEQPRVLGVSEEVPPRADNTGTQTQSSVTPALPHASPATEDTTEAAEVLRTGVVLEAGEIDSSTVAGHLVASSTAEVGTSSPVTRISRKLAFGALWGVVPSYFSGMFLTLATGNTEGFGAGLVLQFTVALGYPLGVAAGVSRVDPHDRFIHALAGSGVGLLANFYIPIPYQFSAFDWDVIWNWFVCPLVGATIASELGRDPTESRRFSIDVVPSPGALSAAATLRF